MLALFSPLMTAPVRAQEEPPAPAPVTPPAVAPPKPTAPPETILLSEADTALYKKAIEGVRLSKGAKIESDLKMVVEGDALKITISEKLSITGKAPNKFRAYLAVTAPTQTTATKFTVVSDGQKTFVHRPGTKQYAVRKVGNGGMNPFETGLYFGFLVLATSKDSMGNLDALRTGGGTVTVADETVNGKAYRVFAIAPPDESFKLRYYIDPATALIEQIEMSAKDNGQSILITEQIHKQSLAAPLTASTFQFAPPKGTKRVPKIAVDDF
jgi:outer membrane lipoprotein-sorting protein